ncbi:response regulator [Dyadobacter psychrotolerans]|uniref:Response regulator n=1 Tax=Dyadobacter psychrotolerans TaxID=2541721 RepID=A0A4R5DYY0_9BACT|nr:response regulator [Dyadobacter psychrotolerans]TDE17371.1 response regulator [Dyadobacter psychrotolerans]
MNRDLYIVDDSADHQFLMYKLLKDSVTPYPIKFFESGQALYRHIQILVQTSKPDFLPALIILDLNMPGMNGIGLLKLLRQISKANNLEIPEIPVVIMSSDISSDQINQCYQAGANAVVVKPFDYNQMKNTVLSICRFWIRNQDSVLNV